MLKKCPPPPPPALSSSIPTNCVIWQARVRALRTNLLQSTRALVLDWDEEESVVQQDQKIGPLSVDIIFGTELVYASTF